MQIRARFNENERVDLLDKAQRCLWTKEGKPGLDYLLGRRCLSEDVIRQFRLGYVPAHVRYQMAHRIIIPLYDASSNLIVLTSRLVDDEFESPLPKHWHESYEKGFYLYGVDIAKEHIRRLGFCVLCEGQFDVLQAHKNGIRNAVGLCCTKLTDWQFSIIRRYCDEIILVLDADDNRTGQKATTKLLQRDQFDLNAQESSFKVGWKIESVDLELGTDPDEFLRKYGGTKMKEMIQDKILSLRGTYAC